MKIVEIPPGPPVLDTLVAEIYGPTPAVAQELARRRCARLFEATPGVVDVDDSLEAERVRVRVGRTARRPALKGIAAAAVVETLAGPGDGRDVGRARSRRRRASRCR